MKVNNSLAAIVVGLVVFTLAALLSQPLKTMTSETNTWLPQVGLKLILVVVSLMAARLFRLPFSHLGFNRNRIGSTRKFILMSLLLGALGSSFVLISGIPRMPGLSNRSILQIILTIWLWSSICEEIFARGFVQGLLRNSTKTFMIGNIQLSEGALASAIVFSAIHFSIYLGGGSLSTCFTIMTLTFFLGLLAGKARDESNLLAAVYVHIAFNVGGAIGGIITNVISFLITGERIV